MSPGEAVKTLRLERGMSQRELSERTGLTQSAISAIEHEAEPLGLARAVRIAEALGVHYRDILGHRRPIAVADTTRRHRPESGGCAYPDMPHVPNAKTRAAFKELERGGPCSAKDVPSLLAQLNADD